MTGERTTLLLGGAPRSGTGLLRRVVGSHPSVALAPFELALHRRVDAGDPPRSVAREAEARLGLDPGALDADSYGALLRAFLEELRRRSDRPIAGDKTPGIELHTGRYRRWLPGERLVLVQMLRDPFDTVASHLAAPWHRAGSSPDVVRTVAQGWCESALIALRGAAHVEVHLVVRYEELTSAPHEVARRIATAIGVDDSPGSVAEMVEGRSFPRHVNSSFAVIGDALHGTVHQALPRRMHLDDEQQAVVGAVCGDLVALLDAL